MTGRIASGEGRPCEPWETQEAVEAAERLVDVERVRADDEASRASGLESSLADAERRLANAEDGRRLAQERSDTLDRAEIARQGQGALAPAQGRVAGRVEIAAGRVEI
jgi:serine phosphatase RsbU (regulator of sigma subunit)